jgi:glyoxylase-like metal-dependent hydrolase (beta-lactamase superfamily II)
MSDIDLLTKGFSFDSDQGMFGWSSISLIKSGNQNILIDTGPASRRKLLIDTLAEKNLTPSDIDIVVLTHMHWDHCQNTDLFISSSIIIHSHEIDYMKNPTSGDLMAASYLTDMMTKLRLNPVDDGDVIAEGVRVMATPGHTKGHMSVLVESSEGLKTIAGDALPDAGTIVRGLPYNIFWDEHDARESLEKMIDKSDIFYPGHDTPFILKENKVQYLDAPSTITISGNSESGVTTSVNYEVLPKKKVNINTFQKNGHSHNC